MFRVGDRVWNMRYGWGEVTDISRFETYPVRVQFEKNRAYYTEDGKAFEKDLNRSIFFEEIEIPKGALVRSRWRANYGGSYWYVESTGAITIWGDHRGSVSNDRYDTGNYFKTEKEAMASKIYKAFHEEVE